jgi:hypothetical protein
MRKGVKIVNELKKKREYCGTVPYGYPPAIHRPALVPPLRRPNRRQLPRTLKSGL